eukprot:Nk52_evm25s304 gene=Nk52_evmTU25s304
MSRRGSNESIMSGSNVVTSINPLEINSSFSSSVPGNVNIGAEEGTEVDVFGDDISSWLFNVKQEENQGLLQLTSDDFFAGGLSMPSSGNGKKNAYVVPRLHRISDSDESSRNVCSPDSGSSDYGSVKARDSMCYVPNSPNSSSGGVDNSDGAIGTHRKKAHLASEKKRRTNLKDAFEELKMLVPSCRNFPQHKNSKESILRKAINYIKFLVKQQYLLVEEIQSLKATIKNAGLEVPPSPCESMISEDVVSGQASGNGIPECTKVFILLTIVDSIFESFQAQIKTGSAEELTQTLLVWIQKNCKPDSLSTIVMSSLKTIQYNFSPSTDGSSCRIRKWTDAINSCNVAGYDDLSMSKVRECITSVTNHVGLAW